MGEGGDSALTMEKSWKELVLGHEVGLKRYTSPLTRQPLLHTRTHVSHFCPGKDKERPWDTARRRENI